MERLRRRFPHALVLGVRARRPRAAARPSARTHGRSDHDIALDFVAELRGVPATDDESALLREACDACCDDRDLDTLVAGGA